MAQPDDPADRMRIMINRWDEHFQRQKKNRDNSRRMYYGLHITAAIAAGITPLLIIWDNMPKVAQAIFPTIASITLAIDAIIHARSNWLRHGRAVAELDGERALFETKSGAYASLDEGKAIALAMRRIIEISNREFRLWETTFRDEKSKSITEKDFDNKAK